ncbi:hypothetical protein ACQZ6F_27485 [Rhizobium sp. A22-96]
MPEVDTEFAYAVRRDAKRTWTVYETTSHAPASMGDMVLEKLSLMDAEDFMALLNWVDARRRECGNL